MQTVQISRLVLALTDDELEEFVRQWTGRKAEYLEVQRYGATLPSVHERSQDGSRHPSGHWLAQSHDLRESGKPAAVRSATAWLSAIVTWRAGEPIEPPATELLTKER